MSTSDQIPSPQQVPTPTIDAVKQADKAACTKTETGYTMSQDRAYWVAQSLADDAGLSPYWTRRLRGSAWTLAAAGLPWGVAIQTAWTMLDLEIWDRQAEALEVPQ